MPAISIDSFFAYTLIVIVVVLSMAATTKIVMPYMASLQDVNEEEYLLRIVEHTLTSAGSPANWGQNSSLSLDSFGLAESGGLAYELDIDKVSRLNSANAYSLSYLEMYNALRVNKVAMHFSFTQVLNVSITLDSNVTIGDSSVYSFTVSVSHDNTPVPGNLQCYIIAENFFNSTTSAISSSGQATVEVTIHNSSSGPALLVVFARSSYDERLTAHAVYPFGHRSTSPQPNSTFLSLSPLNYTLHADPNYSGATLGTSYALTYSYASTLTATSNETFAIPRLLDFSPKVLAVTGWNSSSFFIEWAAYPQIPLEMGANFQNVECYSFNFIVAIDRVFYRLNVLCGGPSL